MGSRLSKFVLTTHLIFSLGWLGAIVVFLTLATTGVINANTQLARSAYLAMEVSGWFVIVPFCFASLFTGIVQAFGTKWGLFRHYWIVVKLVLTVSATVLLMLHMKPVSLLAGAASETSFSTSTLPGLRMQLIGDAGAALLLLLIITTISVYKPWGQIQFSHTSKTDIALSQPVENRIEKKSPGLYLLIGIAALILIFIIIHLLGGGMKH